MLPNAAYKIQSGKARCKIFDEVPSTMQLLEKRNFEQCYELL